ncbi:16S rRNA (cytidine(1402)-2'-O)-methyltransferase [Kangiella sp. TOML190]|uniref:16S rRNA (cytidine(1402)-2'-O)-methyltransferase n=1 Tax=Kangiella sp. TOML190 TaxID=2931351 RepID=UPI0020419754|nr:16S rRNA (cytidine(1402)-2'-O)-methyltransferase [Kangiella sp. TOML190]
MSTVQQSQAASGTLYVVATPIGNIEDISARAIRTLKQVALIAAEDTRHSQRLCQHYSISTPMISVHEHNEVARVELIQEKLMQGQDIALISDAGTPLISDPGYKLIRELRSKNCNISPIPGPSAIITALSVAGLPTDSFSFWGFLPAKSSGRKKKFESLKHNAETLVFYESSHRIAASLQDAQEVLGNRKVVIARELTKTFETILSDTLENLNVKLVDDHNQQKGEFVILVEGLTDIVTKKEYDSERLLSVLLSELAPNKAAKLVAKLTGEKKQQIYNQALALQAKD